MIRLQERDKEILRVCYEQQFLLTEHIRDHFFGGNYAEAKRRVIELRQSDYLQGAGFRIGKKMAHILGHRGMPIATAKSPLEVVQYPRIDLETVEHDAIVTDIRLRLSALWDGEWIPEKGIRSTDSSQIPDGVFLFPDGKQAAVEVENSLKGRARFERRLKFWPGSGVTLVLYVATTPEIYAALQIFLEKAEDFPVCGLISLEELRAGNLSVWAPRVGEIAPFEDRTLP